MSGTEPVHASAEVADTPLDWKIDPTIHDVVIIGKSPISCLRPFMLNPFTGAGPCGLAVAARMREDTPSALFTDFEHQRWHWLRKHSHRQNRLKTRGRAGNMVVLDPSDTRRTSTSYNPSAENDHHMHANDYSIKVLDNTGSVWMEKWQKLFSAYDIKTLRSPMFFHPGPEDRDGLKAFAYVQRRENEMTELKNICGKEISKHQKKKSIKRNARKDEPRGKAIDERDKQDYYTPSTALFEDYCKDCVSRYRLDRLVEQADVVSVRYNDTVDDSWPHQCFRITTTSGEYYARAVVMATGPGTPTPIPISLTEGAGACHTSALLKMGPVAPHVRRKVELKQTTNVIVIGGGLTSAQVAHLALKQGVTKVYHIMRSEYKEKNFDLELSWLAKYKNVNLAEYWGLESEGDRVAAIIEARNGGSITPAYSSTLKALMEKGKMERHTKTTIASKTWDSDTMQWTITTTPSISLPKIDFIYYATGANIDINKVPLVEDLMRDHPIATTAGFPCLTNELQWNEEVPFFVAGRYASLRLGPGAANLEGARTGAERIVSRIQELGQQWKQKEERMRDISKDIENEIGTSDHNEKEKFANFRTAYGYGASHCNMYDALAAGDEGD